MTLSYQVTSVVRHGVAEGILSVEIDRPEKRNPLSLGVLAELGEIFGCHAKDRSLRFAILGGAGGKAFASGGDIDELSGFRSLDDATAFSKHGKAALDRIRYFPVPVIALIEGVAFGGGAELALACDLRIVSSDARIGFIHGRLRIAPSWGGGVDLMRLVGPARALAMMARADILDATEAAAIGLVDRVAPPGDLAETLSEFTTPFRNQSPQVMRAYKSLAINDRRQGHERGDSEETDQFATVWAHDDHWSAVATMERRKT